MITARFVKFFRSFKQTWLWPAIFILPCLIGLVIFTYIPVLMSFGLSFSYWNLLGTPKFIGLENYITVLSDSLFWKTLNNTIIFTVATVSIEVTVALALSVILTMAIRGISIFRTIFFLPFVTPMVSVALVWGWLYDPKFGWLNWVIRLFGGEPIAWLFDANWAMPAIILLRVWKDLGYNMVILMAGLQGVPLHLYESASLDGAGAWQRFTDITLPMLSPTLFFVVMVTLINTFQAFDAVYLLTQGGPENSTQVLVYLLYNHAFQYYKVGSASAIAYILFVIILVVTLVQWVLRKRWVLYETES